MRAISALFLLLFSALLFSCNGQVKNNTSQKEPTDTVLKSNTSTTSQNRGLPYVQSKIQDPLFYIDGQLCQHLRKIYQDSFGNLWFGTNVYGIMRYDGVKLEYFDKEEGMANGRITAILEDKVGNVWFGSAEGLIKFDGTAFTSFGEKEGLHNAEIWSIYLDDDGTFWIGTTNGVSRFDGKEFSEFTIKKADVKDAETVYSFDRITHILKDKDGAMWFGTDGYGITKYDKNGFAFFTEGNGLCDNNITEMMLDSRGNIWIGTYFGGLSTYDGKAFTNFTENGRIEGVEVGGFFEDKKGNIWFAVENYGVYKYNGGSFTNLNAEQGLNTNGVLSIYQDKQNRFWFGGWGGLFRYQDNSFVSVTSDGPWH